MPLSTEVRRRPPRAPVGPQLHFAIYGLGHPSGCPGPLSQIETFVTLCGIVEVRAKVLGRLGRKPSPHPGACALSYPSRGFYRPGSYGAPAFILPVGRALPTSPNLLGAAFRFGFA